MHAVQFVAEMAQRDNRAGGPFPQLLHQFVSEAFYFVGVRSYQDPVEFLNQGKGKHLFFLFVVVVLAREIAYRRKDDDVVVELSRFFFERAVYCVVKNRICLAQKSADRFSFA